MGKRDPIPDEVEPFPPTFAQELQPSLVKIGEDSSWVLPEIVNGSSALVDVEVVPELLLSGLIDYDVEKNTVSFSGVKASKRLYDQFYKIRITLIDENNLYAEYTQQVIVQKLQPEEPTEPENQEKSTDAIIDSSPLEDKSDFAEKPNET